MSDHFHIDFASAWKKYSLPNNQVVMLNGAQKLVYDKIREQQGMSKWASIENRHAGAASLHGLAEATAHELSATVKEIEKAVKTIPVRGDAEFLLPAIRRIEMLGDLVETLGTDLGEAADRIGDSLSKDLPGTA